MSADKSDYEIEHDALRYTLLTGAEVEGAAGTEWLVKTVLPTRGVAAIFGASMSGKTFLALDLALTVAEGATWFGHRIPRNVPVVYAPLEAAGGIKHRLRAWREARDRHTLPDRFRVLKSAPFNLGEPADAEALGRSVVNTVGPGAVIVLDTLHRAMAGADENSATDMGMVIEGAQRLQAIVEGLVVLIHHSGKDASKGMRGSSALLAALDAAIEVKANGDSRSWAIAKSKDGEAGGGSSFQLRKVSWGVDSDGDPLSSCTVEQSATPGRPAKQPTGKNQSLALQQVRAMLAIGAETPEWKGLTKRAALEAIAAELVAEGSPIDRSRERATEALNGLIRAEFLVQQVGGLSLDKILISEPQ